MHRVASLAKRWLLGTYQAPSKPRTVQSHLDEFCFRFNRRPSRQRGVLLSRLVELAVDTAPVTYDDLTKNPCGSATSANATTAAL